MGNKIIDEEELGRMVLPHCSVHLQEGWLVPWSYGKRGRACKQMYCSAKICVEQTGANWSPAASNTALKMQRSSMSSCWTEVSCHHGEGKVSGAKRCEFVAPVTITGSRWGTQRKPPPLQNQHPTERPFASKTLSPFKPFSRVSSQLMQG